jgi:hypothetical protein
MQTQLKTNRLLNIVKFLVAIPVILIFTLMTKVFSFYGVEFLAVGAFLVFLIWNFRVVSKGCFESGDADYTAKVSVNSFGHKKIMLSSNKEKLVERFSTIGEELIVKFGQLEVRLERLGKDDPVFTI